MWARLLSSTNEPSFLNHKDIIGEKKKTTGQQRLNGKNPSSTNQPYLNPEDIIGETKKQQTPKEETQPSTDQPSLNLGDINEENREGSTGQQTPNGDHNSENIATMLVVFTALSLLIFSVFRLTCFSHQLHHSIKQELPQVRKYNMGLRTCYLVVKNLS
ncbi:hypothetical protein L6164_004331 [Bauhinia variegata]|uniref:Uncharacterized protein n=1 Tax=Bauhinia variegata TaxID=167791 RepID=A0ACB9Q3I8_BAUVA|nr:hypothetical protein L6164_004331 [Bauhinia variegata]